MREKGKRYSQFGWASGGKLSRIMATRTNVIAGQEINVSDQSCEEEKRRQSVQFHRYLFNIIEYVLLSRPGKPPSPH